MNLFTLEGVYEDGRVSSVIKKSDTIRTVQGFLRAHPGLGLQCAKRGIVQLFVRWYKSYHGEWMEYEETHDWMDLDWVKKGSKFLPRR